jgi:hypothetical protein
LSTPGDEFLATIVPRSSQKGGGRRRLTPEVWSKIAPPVVSALFLAIVLKLIRMYGQLLP